MKSFFQWLIKPHGQETSLPQIIVWWEARRIPYNLIVGVVGIVSLLLFFLFIHLAHELEPGEDAIEPIALIFAPIAINILYTAGWLAELFLRVVCRQKFERIGPILFTLGLAFSLVVILLPSTVWFITWVTRSI